MRDFVIALGLVMLVGAGVLRLMGAPIQALWPLAFLGLSLSLGTIFERRYKPLRDGRPGPDWRDTGERFIDPESGRPVAVFTSATGERQYRVTPTEG